MKNPLFFSIFRPISIFSLALCLMFLASCNKEDDIPAITTDIWFSESRGFYLDLENGANALYSTSEAGTILFDDDFDLEDFDLIETTDELSVLSKGSLSPIIFKRVSELPEITPPTTNPQINFDFFWNTFNDYYAFFNERGVDWEAQKNLRETVTESNLLDVLSQTILLLEDGHVNILTPDYYLNSGMYRMGERLNAYLDPADQITESDQVEEIFEDKNDVITSKYLNGNVESLPGYPIYWGKIEEGVGYLNILEMTEFGGDVGLETSLANVELAMDEIMQFIQNENIEKFIIDVRFNGGGEDLVSLEIAARFFDQERPVFSKKARDGNGFTPEYFAKVAPKGDFQFTKDIVLLTGPFTASAAEIFSLAMQELPHTTVVGEFTEGVFSDVLPHALPNGTQITLSNEVYLDASGNSLETIGVGPKTTANTIPFLKSSDIHNGTDGGIERALEVLKQ
ncbi:MAG: S41 family peptidase [Chitinophagales bacterium]